ncbi:MAG: hypothetical protein IPL95_13665 [Saprospiraceae bacterium]|nr:hypothetical protein [Saprospiraceae bacterium]
MLGDILSTICASDELNQQYILEEFVLDGHIHLQSINYDMMDSEIELFLRENFIGASLESFGIKHQFLELTFSNSKYEDILFNIDCKIDSNNSKFKDCIEKYKSFDKYVYIILFFLEANLKKIEDFSFDNSNCLYLIFENEYRIYFDLSNSDSDLSISFIQNIGDRASYVINFMIQV